MNSPVIKKLATMSLIFIFFVILAGSIVRATGSGMGCPDWPQCFGYNIPPSNIETLTWRSGKVFKQGQMILLDNHFWIANSDLITAKEFSSTNWTKFDRHEYTVFNPVHTWIEFINRLLGALSGLPIFLMTLIAFIQIRKSVWNALLSGSVLFLLGFEAWLGKRVVDGNLVPNQITIHMMGSVAIVLLLLVLRARNDQYAKALPKSILRTLVLLLLAVVVQIFLGTQTRELVDIAVDQGFSNRFDIIPSIEELMPRVHRSFAWFILAIASLLFYQKRVKGLHIPGFNALIFAIALEWTVGVVLYFFGVPQLMQPLHLVLSIGILSSISYPLFLALRRS